MSRPFAWYRKAADQNVLDAQLNLGCMFERGRGVKQDFAQAVRLYRLAAKQNDAVAQRNLGCMYRDGLGVQKDDA